MKNSSSRSFGIGMLGAMLAFGASAREIFSPNVIQLRPAPNYPKHFSRDKRGRLTGSWMSIRLCPPAAGKARTRSIRPESVVTSLKSKALRKRELKAVKRHQCSVRSDQMYYNHPDYHMPVVKFFKSHEGA